MTGSTLCLLLSICISGTTSPDLGEQRDYQRDPVSSQMRPKSVLQSLSEDPISDVQVEFDPPGNQQFFGQIRFGSEDSTRVAILLDQLSDDSNDFALYVDLDRDRILTEQEMVEGQGRSRQFELEAEIKQVGPPIRETRWVRFRRSIDERSFSISTLGGCLYEIQIDGASVSVWRRDGNGNGLFSDRADEIWIDLDDDGKWDPIAERFPFRSMIRLREQRFAVRADRLGGRFELAKIEGEGKLGLDFDLLGGANISKIRATVYGDDGSAHSIESAEPIKLPVGRYMLGQLTIVVKESRKTEDSKSKKQSRPWTFSFTHYGDENSKRWYIVTKDEQATISPLQDLELSLNGPEVVVAGEATQFRPQLMTPDGLYITNSSYGEVEAWDEGNSNPASVKAISSEDQPVWSGSSGFK